MQQLTFSLVVLSLSMISLGKVAMAAVLSEEGEPPLLAVAPQYEVINKVRAAIISKELEVAMGTVYGPAAIIDQISIPNTDDEVIRVRSGTCEFEVTIEPISMGGIGVTHYQAKKATPVITELCTKRGEADVSTNSPEPYWEAVGVWQYLIISFYSDIYNEFPYSWDKPKSIRATRASDATTFTILSTSCTLDVVIQNDLTRKDPLSRATCHIPPPVPNPPHTRRSPAH